jgi:hypothetical protein
MLRHADSLKIRIDYFQPRHASEPRHAALPSIDLHRFDALLTHRYALHASVLGIVAGGTFAALLR